MKATAIINPPNNVKIKFSMTLREAKLFLAGDESVHHAAKHEIKKAADFAQRGAKE